MSLHPNEVLLAPVVSEKSYAQIEDNNTYSFRIHPDAHKTQVRRRSRSCSTSRFCA